MGNKLYELTDQYRFLDNLSPEDGDEAAGMIRALAEIKDSIIVKAESVAKYVLMLDADASIIKAEEERLKARRQVIEHKSQWVRDYLHRELINAEMDKVPGELVTVSLRKAPVSVNIVDESLIPASYLKYIPASTTPDKKAITDNFKATGEEIPGVQMITDKKTLTIK